MNAPSKRKRRLQRKRRIPNPRPGLEGGTIPDEPTAPVHPPSPAPSLIGGAAAKPETDDSPEPYVPKGILAVRQLDRMEDLAEDFSLLTPEQRKFWAGAKARHRRITPTDKRKFLDSLARLPSVAGAARESGFAIRTWYCLRARDPAFAAEWDTAVKAGVPVLEHAAMVRAFHGTERPIFQNGKHVASELVVSDRLAEVLLRAHDPARFSEKMMVSQQVSGTINHVHHLSPALEAMFAGIAGDRGSGETIEGQVDQPALPSSSPGDILAEMLGRRGNHAEEEQKAAEPTSPCDDENK